ncbi:ParM/StbA family protein [Paenibacillus sp. NRS-1760]|uniref:ParM/StbA family protein n=1 Tax=Paenibacillus sp. NRS-1760 TaxID=3233902 RepID=UPI003D2E405F
MILGIDAGNHRVKVVNKNGAFDFASDIGEWRQRNLITTYGPDDMEFEYNDRKGFAGLLARYESEFSGSIKGDTKANEDAKLRVLLAVHQYSSDTDNAIVVGQPISKHTDDEKLAIKNMLIGVHTMTVNGVTKTFRINRVEVGAECASTGMLEPPLGYFHIVDLGGGTLNWATCYYDGESVRKIDRDSDTELFGMDTVKQADITAMSRLLISKTQSKWSKENPVRVIGGVAEKLSEALQSHYVKAAPYQPLINGNRVSPTFGSAAAFYAIAKGVYGEQRG